MALTAEAHGLTDVGRKRQHNEDAFAVDSELGLFVVADGMGGHAAGEVASARAVEVVREQLGAGRQVLEELAQANKPEARAAAAALVETAIQRACAEVYKLASSDPTKRGMGTTFVCLVMAGTKGIVGHVGDSRVYLVRGGQAHRLTEDHTLIAAQVKAGTLTREQAQLSQFRNVITRAVGIQESVQVDTLMVDLLPKDRFVLCSDGMHGYLADDELAPLATASELEELPEKLVALANDRGGKDNITVVVVGISDAGAAPEELEETTSRMEVLKSIPIFRHLTYKEQTAILSIASTKAFPAESEIIVEGQSGDELYIVVKGRVRVETGGVGVAGSTGGTGRWTVHAPRSATVERRADLGHGHRPRRADAADEARAHPGGEAAVELRPGSVRPARATNNASPRSGRSWPPQAVQPSPRRERSPRCATRTCGPSRFPSGSGPAALAVLGVGLVGLSAGRQRRAADQVSTAAPRPSAGPRPGCQAPRWPWGESPGWCGCRAERRRRRSVCSPSRVGRRRGPTAKGDSTSTFRTARSSGCTRTTPTSASARSRRWPPPATSR